MEADAVKMTPEELTYNIKLQEWTEYWAYRRMVEHQSVKNQESKSDDSIHAETIKRMRRGSDHVSLHEAQTRKPKD